MWWLPFAAEPATGEWLPALTLRVAGCNTGNDGFGSAGIDAFGTNGGGENLCASGGACSGVLCDFVAAIDGGDVRWRARSSLDVMKAALLLRRRRSTLELAVTLVNELPEVVGEPDSLSVVATARRADIGDTARNEFADSINRLRGDGCGTATRYNAHTFVTDTVGCEKQKNRGNSLK